MEQKKTVKITTIFAVYCAEADSFVHTELEGLFCENQTWKESKVMLLFLALVHSWTFSKRQVRRIWLWHTPVRVFFHLCQLYAQACTGLHIPVGFFCNPWWQKYKIYSSVAESSIFYGSNICFFSCSCCATSLLILHKHAFFCKPHWSSNLF